MATRREILAAAIAAPALAAPAVARAAPAFACLPMAVSPEWQGAVARMDAASAAHDAYYEATYEPAWETAKATARQADEQLQRRLDAIPHYTTSLAYETADGNLMHMTTANRLDIGRAIGGAQLTDPSDYVSCCREMVSLINKRMDEQDRVRAEFEQSKVYPAQLISPEIAREEKRLGDASHAAFKAVYNFAAAAPADLIAKIEFLKSRDIDIDHDQMLADLRRVFGEA
ncbi:hypothetical protein HH800_02440 [Sphingobium yanoikuyae]|uniref:Uncharacterized protein n=1 Tax=Sphingobium yanoikuyae TaxID=13690 RepID=A0A6M4G674_SPHYA|nr:hypothetical protein [Sphingobium yanoikuyae]QJR01157.1 hypothetical protein HH800_02440 [Sphingobium yanoikuyae]